MCERQIDHNSIFFHVSHVSECAFGIFAMRRREHWHPCFNIIIVICEYIQWDVYYSASVSSSLIFLYVLFKPSSVYVYCSISVLETTTTFFFSYSFIYIPFIIICLNIITPINYYLFMRLIYLKNNSCERQFYLSLFLSRSFV